MIRVRNYVRQDETEGAVLTCPNCGSPDYLGENVTGWREVRLPLRHVGEDVLARGAGSVYDEEHESFFCSGPQCNTETPIRASQLVPLGQGTQVEQDPNQERLL
jgi:hypothetical protein